jgi:predicted Holliday junction resolvase-like endonuclease
MLVAEHERAKKSLSTSRSVVKGQLAEQMFPLSIECPFLLSDMKFFGQPIDYIVLDGYSNGDIKEVVFVEIKTGNARLSSIQRSLRDCIDAKRVSWATVTIKESEHDRANRSHSEETGASNTAA